MSKKGLVAWIISMVAATGVSAGGTVLVKNAVESDDKALNALYDSKAKLIQELGDSTAYAINKVNVVTIDNKEYEISADAVTMKKGERVEVDLNITGEVEEKDKSYCENVTNSLEEYKNDPTVEKLTKYIKQVTKLVQNSTITKVEESKVEIVESKVPARKIVDMALSSCLEENGMLSETYKAMYKECSETKIEDVSKMSIQQISSPKVKDDGTIEGVYGYQVNTYALVGTKVCSVNFKIENEKQLNNDFLNAYVTGLLTVKNSQISLVDPKDDTVEKEMAKLFNKKDSVTDEELEAFKTTYGDVKYEKEFKYEDVATSAAAFSELESKLAEFEETLDAEV